MHTIEIGPNLTGLGLLGIILHYFAPLIIVGIVLTVGYFIGRHFYGKYKEKRANESLLDGFKRIRKL